MPAVRPPFYSLAEIDNLAIEKQKVTDKLDVAQKLKDSFRGNNL